MKKPIPILFPGLLAFLAVALPGRSGAEDTGEWREAEGTRHENGRLVLQASCGEQQGWVWVDPERENSIVIRPLGLEQDEPVLVLPFDGEDLEVHHLPQVSSTDGPEDGSCLGWLGRDVLETLSAAVEGDRLRVRMPSAPTTVTQKYSKERVF